MSGTGRDHSGLDAGTTRSMSMGDAPGQADVHAGIAFNAHAGEEQGLRDRTVNRVKDVAGSVADSAGDLGQRARSLAGDVADRAGNVASQARDRMGELTDRAQQALDDRGILNRIRENPLPVLGVAFAAGFLLAGGGSGGSRGGGEHLSGGGGERLSGGGGSRAQRVRGELRSALAAGLSAGLAQGARAFLRNAGAEDGVINSLMESIPGMGGGQDRGGRSEGYPGGGSRSQGYSAGGRQQPQPRGGQYPGTGSTSRHREPSHREHY